MSTLKVNSLLDTSGNFLGRINQIKFGTTTAQLSTTSTSYVDISSDLALTLTPASSSSVILLLFTTTGQINGSRGRYDVHYSGTNSQISGATAMTAFEGTNINHCVAFQFRHAPNTTSSITYKPQHQNQSGSTVFTGCGNITTFTAIEILQ